jgi:hypothetical protein
MDTQVILCGTKLATRDKDFFCLRDDDQPINSCCGILSNAVVIHKRFNLTLSGLTYLLSRLRRNPEQIKLPSWYMNESLIISHNHDKGCFIFQLPNTNENRDFYYAIGWGSDQFYRLFEDMFDFCIDNIEML